MELEREWKGLVEVSRSEFFTLLNAEVMESYSKPLLKYLSERLGKDVYRIDVVNVISLEFLLNNSEKFSMEELRGLKSFSIASYLSRTFPHVFAFSSELSYMRRENLEYYSKLFSANDLLKGLLSYIRSDDKVELNYSQAVYLLAFLKHNELLTKFLQRLKSPLKVLIEPSFPSIFQISNIIFLVDGISVRELFSSLIFRGKYKTEEQAKKQVPLKKKLIRVLFPREDIDTVGGVLVKYEFEGKNYYFTFDDINSYTEIRYKVRFEPSLLA
ncbi:MAG: hypothetical protein QXV69_04730 [Sulfolobaceae archaeon]